MTHEQEANIPIEGTIAFSINQVIAYLERTNEEAWCEDVIKTKDGKSCVKGHIFDMGGNIFMDLFESVIATDYMIFPINDGKHENYQQSTPKQRVLAYLRNMKEGNEPTTQQIFDMFDAEREAEFKSKELNVTL